MMEEDKFQGRKAKTEGYEGFLFRLGRKGVKRACFHDQIFD